jgi:hypothetical protein
VKSARRFISPILSIIKPASMSFTSLTYIGDTETLFDKAMSYESHFPK